MNKDIHQDGKPKIKEALDSAAADIKRGNLASGKSKLEWVLQREPDSIWAWLWMSRCVEGTDAKLKCFHRVLAIDPSNEHALKGIQLISTTTKRPKATSAVEKHRDAPSVTSSRLATTKRRRASIILFGFLALIALCICGPLIIDRFSDTSNGGGEISAQVLSARDVFVVSAVHAVESDGYTITSAVCEFVSPMSYLPSNIIFGGQLVFHAFRLTGPDLETEAVVLFASNHTAADGAGLVIPVNAEAIGLDQGFPSGSDLVEPITVDTPGAETALDCAHRVGDPTSLELKDKDFDIEVWRSEAIEMFGPEETFDDGSKEDYVWYALTICDLSEAKKATQRANLGEEYIGSFAQFVIDTFCPHD